MVVSEREKEYKKGYYKDNREEFRKRAKLYYEKNKDGLKNYSKEFYEKNKYEIKRRHSEWQKNNRNKVKEIQKEYRKNNGEKIRENEREYRNKYYKTTFGKWNMIQKRLRRAERLRSVEHKFTKEEWNLKLEKTEGFCPRCNKYISIMNLTLDHIVPLASGRIRTYTIEDVQPLCRSCNCSKGAKVEEKVYGC